MAATATLTTGGCQKHAFAPRAFRSTLHDLSAHPKAARQSAFCTSHRLRPASDISVAGDDPVNEGDPTGLSALLTSSQLSKVSSWASANAGGSNNGYRDDCTDFVSRALNYAHDPESEPPWLPEAEIGGPIPVRLVGENDHYWYRVGYDIFLTAQSNSWSVAHDMAEHLELNGSQFLGSPLHLGPSGCSQNGPYNLPTGVVPGDLIFANWHGSSLAGIDHAGVIVSVGDGNLSIAQHTPGAAVSLSYWQQKADGTPSDTWVWIVHPAEG
jgi:hypothetical protein